VVTPTASPDSNYAPLPTPLLKAWSSLSIYYSRHARRRWGCAGSVLGSSKPRGWHCDRHDNARCVRQPLAAEGVELEAATRHCACKTWVRGAAASVYRVQGPRGSWGTRHSPTAGWRGKHAHLHIDTTTMKRVSHSLKHDRCIHI